MNRLIASSLVALSLGTATAARADCPIVNKATYDASIATGPEGARTWVTVPAGAAMTLLEGEFSVVFVDGQGLSSRTCSAGKRFSIIRAAWATSALVPEVITEPL